MQQRGAVVRGCPWWCMCAATGGALAQEILVVVKTASVCVCIWLPVCVCLLACVCVCWCVGVWLVVPSKQGTAALAALALTQDVVLGRGQILDECPEVAEGDALSRTYTHFPQDF